MACNTLQSVIATTDGSSYPNDGAGTGGWAVILAFGDKTVKLSGAERPATNNQMELTAVLEALKALHMPSRVTIRTDSQYTKNALESWCHKWRANGWVTGKGEPVKNRALIESILVEMSKHEVSFIWVKGHQDDVLNEEADQLAAQARQTYDLNHGLR